MKFYIQEIEKEAINKMTDFKEFLLKQGKNDSIELATYLHIILNLIENEGKEIEKLIEINIKQQEKRCKLEKDMKELKKGQKKLDKIDKYIRSNKWGEDYKISSCRTRLISILEE